MTKTLVYWQVSLMVMSTVWSSEKYENPFKNGRSAEDAIDQTISYNVTKVINETNTTNYIETIGTFKDENYYGPLNGLTGWIEGSEIGANDNNYSSLQHIVNGKVLSTYTGPMGSHDSRYYLYDELKNKKYIQIGDEFPFFTRVHQTVKFDDSEFITNITENVISTSRFTKTVQVSTPWGTKTAIVFEYDINGSRLVLDTDPQTKELRSSWFENQRFGFGITYMINGLGMLSETYTTMPVLWDNESFLTAETLNERFPTVMTSRSFHSTSLELSIKDFIPLTDQLLETNLLNSWTWNGAFPWVYNHDTNSWFYYHYSTNKLNAYDALNQKWFTFDSATNAWSGL